MFTVTATSQSNVTMATVRLTIADINDNFPSFTNDSYTFSLNENTPTTPTVIVGYVEANDVDESGNQPVSRHTCTIRLKGIIIIVILYY